jgi:hypothetical protein
VKLLLHSERSDAGNLGANIHLGGTGHKATMEKHVLRLKRQNGFESGWLYIRSAKAFAIRVSQLEE